MSQSQISSTGGSNTSALMTPDTFDCLWQNIGEITQQGEFTQIVSKENEYHFSDGEGKEATCLEIERMHFASGGVTPLISSASSHHHQVQRYDTSLSAIAPATTSCHVMSPDSQNHISSSSTSPYSTSHNQVGVDYGGSPFSSGHEQLSPENAMSAVKLPAPPTVPSHDPYAGDYNFSINFVQSLKETKSATWTFSKKLHKLYVRMSTQCPIGFKTERPPPLGSKIRATPVFVKADHVQEVVKRCPNHCTKSNFGASNEHFIRCDHGSSYYDEDSLTKRLSVTIDHEHPQAGSEWVTNLFQFMCFSSCVGGLNRRPFQLIFTLEHEKVVLGRQSVNVRCCACPGRDRRLEEAGSDLNDDKNSSRKPKKRPNQKVTVSSQITSVGPASKRRRGDTGGGAGEEDYVFMLHVRGRENYEVLSKLRDSLELVSQLPPATVEDMRLQTIQKDECITSPQQQTPQLSVQKQPSLPRIISIPSTLGFGDKFAGLPSIPSFPTVGGAAGPLPSTSTASAAAAGHHMLNGGMQLQECKVEVQPVIGVVDNLVSSTNLSNPATPEDQLSQGDYTIASWLHRLGLSAYVDNFAQQGYCNMFELQDFSLEELQQMKIGTEHRNQIWRSLVEFRNSSMYAGGAGSGTINVSPVASGGLGLDRSQSNASTVSMMSQQGGGGATGVQQQQQQQQQQQMYEVTRYTFKHTISMTKDHDYHL